MIIYCKKLENPRETFSKLSRIHYTCCVSYNAEENKIEEAQQLMYTTGALLKLSLIEIITCKKDEVLKFGFLVDLIRPVHIL